MAVTDNVQQPHERLWTREKVGKQEKVRLAAYLSSKDFARFLTFLLADSEAYLARLEWGRYSLRGPRRKRAMTDRKTALVAMEQDGDPQLLIPDWQHLRLLELLLFYNDGSVLSASLGDLDQLKVAIGEPRSHAVQRVAKARDHLRSQMNRGLLRFLIRIIIGSTVLISPGFPLLSVLYPVVASEWRWVLSCALSLTLFVPAMNEYNHALLPRENKITTQWRWFEWSKQDLRGLLTGLIVAAIAYIFGRLTS